MTYIAHSKGPWKKHAYIQVIDGQYIYPDDYRGGNAKDYNSPGEQAKAGQEKVRKSGNAENITRELNRSGGTEQVLQRAGLNPNNYSNEQLEKIKNNLNNYYNQQLQEERYKNNLYSGGSSIKAPDSGYAVYKTGVKKVTKKKKGDKDKEYEYEYEDTTPSNAPIAKTDNTVKKDKKDISSVYNIYKQQEKRKSNKEAKSIRSVIEDGQSRPIGREKRKTNGGTGVRVRKKSAGTKVGVNYKRR